MSGSAVQLPETRLNRVPVPLRVDTRVEGVLVVGTKKESSPLTLEDRQLIVAIANQLAVAVDRQGRAEREARARAVDESDRLKSALVSSVSHELKTPLTAIKMSVTGLFWTTSSTITRTSAANWRSRSIADVVDDVLDRMKPIGAGRAIRRDIPNDSPLTPLDFV
jgi:two-component system sensor histidine kinase KdpD